MFATTDRPWLGLAVVGLATAIAHAGCGGADEDPVADESAIDDTAAEDDPQAEDADEPVTLRLVRTFGDLTPAHQHLQDTTATLSDGALRIDIAHEVGEQQTVAMVAAGEIDLAWVGSRAFADLGVTSFDALTAPFLVDSYPLQQAVLDSDIPDRMLDGVEGLGVTGLAVMGGGLRKPFAVDGPLLSPDDYAGITVRTPPSTRHADAITALGAEHDDRSGPQVDDLVADGTINAIENTLFWYEALDARLTPYVTINVTLWPQTAVLIANPDTLAGLTDAQAGWLDEAVRDTASRSVELADVDADQLDDICAWGGCFAEATDADLAALRQAVQPVYDELGQDADTAAYLAEIESLTATIVAEPLDIPDGCTGSPPGAVAEGEDDPSVLNGTYQLEWTVDELVAAGVPEDEVSRLEMAGVITWIFDDGGFADEQRDAPDAEPRQECAGTYGVTADTVEILREAPCAGWAFNATWVLTDDALVFTDALLDGEPNPLLEVWLAGKPWLRID